MHDCNTSLDLRGLCFSVLLCTGGRVFVLIVLPCTGSRVFENYENLANGFRDTFAAINSFINDPVMTINRTNYTLEFFMCADYKVSSIM